MFNEFINFTRGIYGTKKNIPLHEPKFFGNEKKYLNQCIDTTFVSSVGKFVDKFEKKIAKYTGAKYAIATTNGTSAIHISLILAGVNQDDDSDMFTLSVTHISPEFSYTFLSLLIKEVNNVTRQKAIAQSEKSLDYLYQQLSQTTQFDIELSVHQLIESQLNTQMLATVRPEYLVQIFDSPFIPVKKSGPNRRYTVLVYFFASIFIAIVGVLASYFYKLSFRKMST